MQVPLPLLWTPCLPHPQEQVFVWLCSFFAMLNWFVFALHMYHKFRANCLCWFKQLTATTLLEFSNALREFILTAALNMLFILYLCLNNFGNVYTGNRKTHNVFAKCQSRQRVVREIRSFAVFATTSGTPIV